MTTPKKPLFAAPPVEIDPGILTEAERAEVEALAKAEVEAEAKDAARAALKDRLKKEARQKTGLDEATETVTIDLAPYCDRILIDNVAYLQGATYTVPAARAAVMRETMQRTWTHQAEIDGKSENFYRRTRGQRVIPAGDGAAVVNTSQMMRA